MPANLPPQYSKAEEADRQAATAADRPEALRVMVRVQLVDLPPITADYLDPWVPDVVRSADAALLVVDLGDDDSADAAEAVRARLAAAHAELVAALPSDSDDETVQHVKTAIVANK